MRSNKKNAALISVFIFLIFILGIPITAAVYVENPENHENPPASNVHLEDAFTTVAGTDSYVHPVNKQQVVITEDMADQKGAVWYQYPIDLSYDFSFEMHVYLGNKDQNSGGADGMTFTLHNDPSGLSAIGGVGGGLGVMGMKNFLSIEMDTYNNGTADSDVDPNSIAHFAIATPDTYSSSGVHANLVEINDGYFLMDQWRTLDVDWDSSTSTLYYKFENYPQQSYVVDVQKQFGGTSVYWGFTGSTGVLTNFQSVSISKLPQEPTMAHEKKVRNVTAGEVPYSTAVTAETGDIVEFQISIENLPSSMMNLIDAVFQDTLDASLSYIPGTFRVGGSTVTPSIFGDMLSTDLGTIAVGSTEMVTFQCRVTGSGTDGVIHNTAIVGSKYSAYLSSEEADIYVQPDVTIKKAADKTETYSGDVLTYTITLDNEDGAGNWNGKITDQLAADLGDISVSFDTSGYSGTLPTYILSAGNLLTVNNITLKDGECLKVIIQAEIQTDNDMIGSNYQVSNQATATGSGNAPSGSGTSKTNTSNLVTTRLLKDHAAFTITKNLDRAANEDLSFVFQIAYKKSEAASASGEVHYGIVHIPKGQISGSIRFSETEPGFYTVTELENSWRYAIDSSTPLLQTQTINWKSNHDHTFTFMNNYDNSSWQSGSADITNQMSALSAG